MSAELAELRREFPRYRIDDCGRYLQAVMPGVIIKRDSAARLRAALAPRPEDVRLTDARSLLAEWCDPAGAAANELYRMVTRYHRVLADVIEAIDGGGLVA